ncbi:glutamate racemase [Candidatus Microgenomates bacterium]|nr:glutamate racemase [Candidatus Microgenomates bacterium]
MKVNNLPIGIFDSGVGGLTVAKQIAKAMPTESFIYLGDTARIPYGTRSKETIKKFALELARYLLEQNVKCLVIACNSISANALEDIKKISPVPVFDVISPVLKKINKETVVIATKATINSGKYPCTGRSCSMFVPVVEEGFADSEAALLIAKTYLGDLKDLKTLILGCTHFPIMQKTIEKVVGKNVKIVDPATELALELKEKLPKSTGITSKTFFVTDNVEKAKSIAGYFWSESLKYEWRQIVL